jgi:hypothetical protein
MTRSFWRSVDIGNVLVRMGLVTPEQIEHAVQRQAREDRGTRLGEVLVGMGAITRSQLDEALRKQKAMRSGKAVDVMVELVGARMEQLVKHA